MLCQSNHDIQLLNRVVINNTRKTILGIFAVLINNYASVPNKLGRYMNTISSFKLIQWSKYIKNTQEDCFCFSLYELSIALHH